MYRNGPHRSLVPLEVEERRHREKWSDLADHDAWLDQRDRHLPEDGTVGVYSEKHLDAPWPEDRAA